jgi:hypothetical protein
MTDAAFLADAASEPDWSLRGETVLAAFAPFMTW